MSRRTSADENRDWIEEARRHIDAINLGPMSEGGPVASRNHPQDHQSNKWQSRAFREREAQRALSALEGTPPRQRDRPKDSNLRNISSRVARYDKILEESAQSDRACRDQGGQAPFKVTRAVLEKNEVRNGIYKSKLDIDPRIQVRVTTRSVDAVATKESCNGVEPPTADEKVGKLDGPLISAAGTRKGEIGTKQNEKKDGKKKSFYMSKLEMGPGIHYQVARRTMDIRVKEDADEDATSGGGNGSCLPYDKIIKIDRENKSQVVFCQAVPSQMECGQQLCALLNNNRKRGVLVIGVSPGGVVRGNMMDRKDKDLFRQGLDNTLRRMGPVNPADENLVFPPVFRTVSNHPSVLRAERFPGENWEMAGKTPMVVEVEVKSPPEGRTPVHFKYDGFAYKRTNNGDTVLQ